MNSFGATLEVSLLQELGIVHIPAQIPYDVLSQLDEEIRLQMSTQDFKKLGGSIAGHLNYSFCGEHIKLISELMLSRVVPLAKQYLNTQFCRIVIGGNVNLPGSTNQHWHADSDFDDNWLVINCLINDFTKDNGPTEFISMTHRMPMSYLDCLRKRISGKLKSQTLQGGKAGDILIRDSNLWHRGTSNRTSLQRSMVSISIYRSNIDTISSFSDYPGFSPNWFVSSNMKVFERFYVYFPLLFSLLRIYRSFRIVRSKCT
jgi:hypothetical protein